MPSKFQKGIDLRGQRAVNAGDATAPTDLLTLQQAQAFIRGFDWKLACQAASTGEINLSAPGTTIDGVVMKPGYRFLVKDNADKKTNGLYDWNGASSPATRCTDADADVEVTNGLAVTVTGGTVNATPYPTAWNLVTQDSIVIGTTDLVFTPLGGAIQPYTPGVGLVLDGRSFSVKVGNGLLVDVNGVKVDPSIVARKAAFDCVANTNPQTFTHNLGNDIEVAIWSSTGEKIRPDVTRTASQVTVDYGAAPAAGDYRVVCIG